MAMILAWVLGFIAFFLMCCHMVVAYALNHVPKEELGVNVSLAPAVCANVVFAIFWLLVSTRLMGA